MHAVVLDLPPAVAGRLYEAKFFCIAALA